MIVVFGACSGRCFATPIGGAAKQLPAIKKGEGGCKSVHWMQARSGTSPPVPPTRLSEQKQIGRCKRSYGKMFIYAVEESLTSAATANLKFLNVHPVVMIVLRPPRAQFWCHAK